MSEPMELRGVDLVVIPAYQPSALLLDLCEGRHRRWLRCGGGGRWQHHGQAVDLCPAGSPAGGGGSPPPAKPGKGAALKTAFQTVWTWNDPTAYLVTMDADGQHLPQDAERVLQEARTHPGALVLGTRTFGRGCRSDPGWAMR